MAVPGGVIEGRGYISFVPMHTCTVIIILFYKTNCYSGKIVV